MMKKRLHILGMTCPRCEDRVTRALSSIAGVSEANASFTQGTADIVLKHAADEKALLPLMEKAVREAGYQIV
ncbi:MAG: heavy-metal-associated domain-containing protein, partial [Mailhella sp.]|nr:heavy-metal-associated domain-containing protein [Mailhella sp.]